jgi:hypothetical protein
MKAEEGQNTINKFAAGHLKAELNARVQTPNYKKAVC